MLREFKADLHIHTCLSPCAELQMTPSAIVKAASGRGLNIIAITDHNSAENVIAAKKSAKDTGLTVLAGMEVTTSEEVHIIAVFNGEEGALRLQDIVYEHLLGFKDDYPLSPLAQEDETGSFPGHSGSFEQVVVNEKDEVMRFNRRLLISATSLTAYAVVDTIHSLGGCAIASHIDREVFGIISQLGFIPPDLRFDALEISPNTSIEEAKKSFPEYGHIPWLTSSDSHHRQDIGRASTGFLLQSPTFEELCLALKGIEGRKVIL